MPTFEVLVRIEGPSTAALESAWVYIHDAGVTTTYRTDPSGRLRRLTDGAPNENATLPWKYDTKVLLEVPKTVRLFTSRGARPLPKTVLDSSVFNDPHAYSERSIALPTNSPPNAIAASSATVVAIATAEVHLPANEVRLTQPAELSLCPVLWEQAAEDATDDAKDYLRAGIGQGTSTPGETSTPAVPPTGVSVHERGVVVKGQVAAAAQHVRVRFFDGGGNALQLRTSPTAAPAQEIEVSTTGGSGGRVFEANVWFDQTANAFGLVHVIVESHDPGEERHHLDGFTVLLAGLQIAMVDDSTKNINGAQPGDVLRQADERVVLDFKKSPVRDVASCDLFVHAFRVKKLQADKAAKDKAANLAAVSAGFEGLRVASSNASTALATVATAAGATQAQAALTTARAQLMALRTAFTAANLSARITTALQNTPNRDATTDSQFDTAMQALATALAATNAAIVPALTQAVAAMTTALGQAEQEVVIAQGHVATEVSSGSAVAHGARVTATAAATAQLQTFETTRASGLSIATNARNGLVGPAGPANTALQQAEVRNGQLRTLAKNAANAALAEERRARRMVSYLIRGDQQRAYNATGPSVPHPSSPR